MNYYDLERIKVLITQEQYRITTSAIQSAHDMGLYEEDICECIVDYLNATHFYKSMPSERFQGLWQDVYKLRYRGFRIYLKLQIRVNITMSNPMSELYHLAKYLRVVTHLNL